MNILTSLHRCIHIFQEGLTTPLVSKSSIKIHTYGESGPVTPDVLWLNPSAIFFTMLTNFAKRNQRYSKYSHETYHDAPKAIWFKSVLHFYLPAVRKPLELYRLNFQCIELQNQKLCFELICMLCVYHVMCIIT